MAYGPTHPLLELIDSLYRAASDRHLARVRDLLQEAGAGQLPHDVREEAIALARAPINTLRAPIALLRFRYVLEQLGDDALDASYDPDQLELHLGARDGTYTFE